MIFDGSDTKGGEHTPETVKARIQSVVLLMMEQAREVKRLVAELEEAEKRFRKTERTTLPDLLQEFGLSSIVLDTGQIVELKTDCAASIKEENKQAAFGWLTEHDFDGIIKTKVVSEFSKGQYEQALEAVELLIESGFPADLDQSIHAATLKAFVKEQMAEGTALPLDIFDIHNFKKATIKKGKKK